MTTENTDPESAIRAALAVLVGTLARTSAQTSHDLGIDLDVDDPRVARWLILKTFEAVLTPSARSTPEVLLRRASEGFDSVSSTGKTAQRNRREGNMPLVSWHHLVEAAIDFD